MKVFLLTMIRIYQRLLSPLKNPSCRFYPTCSHYAMQAVEKYGVIKGSRMTLVRLMKCHPFHPGGYDPV